MTTILSLQNKVRHLTQINTAGCVDNGKSTLIGRLLYDCGGIAKDTIEKISRRSGENNSLNLAFFTDGLKEEQARGITIDVARHFVRRDGLDLIIADTPGHQEFTRNMLTGTSNSKATLILVDATKGIVSQNRRHAYIAALMGVEQIIVLVNKMDLVGFSQDKFDEIKSEFDCLISQLHGKKPIYIPISALQGDNVVIRSNKMSWYQGESVIGTLENLQFVEDISAQDLHFVVQWIDQSNGQKEILGSITAGTLSLGDSVVVLPENAEADVTDIRGLEGSLSSLSFPANARIKLNQDLQIERGSILRHPKSLPELTDLFRATICWMDEKLLTPGREYLLQTGSKVIEATVFEIENQIDIESYQSTETTGKIGLNDIAEVKIKTVCSLPWELFSKEKHAGRFILIDK